jgi:hypothetical protein
MNYETRDILTDKMTICSSLNEYVNDLIEDNQPYSTVLDNITKDLEKLDSYSNENEIKQGIRYTIEEGHQYFLFQ